ncbi:MAG: glycosyltransferase family 4 protein [Candidatus Thiodiazotropha sp.]
MKEKVNILFIDNSFTFGGAINSLSHLLKAINRERFIPFVVSGQEIGTLDEHFPDIKCYHYLPKLPWINNKIYLRLIKFPVFKIKVFKKLLNLLRFVYWLMFVHIPEAIHYMRIGNKHAIDIVHLNNILGSQLSGILAAKLLGVPCVAHLRDFEEIHPITRIYAKFIDHHIAISSAIRDNIKQLGVDEKNITLIHDAIDLGTFNTDVEYDYLFHEFNINKQQPRFGIFGRVIDWKGIREFIEATNMVVNKNREVKAFIIGGASDGGDEYMQQMLELAKDLDLQENLIFTGFRQDIPALMKFMDIVVHASITPEPFGMVLIEGMAMGRPVVATRAGGPLDIVVDGKTGILVPMRDSRELANAILTLLEDPKSMLEMGNNGVHRVQTDFGSSLYAEKVEKLYQALKEG